MFHKTAQVGEMSIAATAATSPLIHDCVPSSEDGGRRFFLLVPDKPRYVSMAERRFVQAPGECALADSDVEHTAAYEHPHAAICLCIPAQVLRIYVPRPELLIGKRITSDPKLARLMTRLLLFAWMSAEHGSVHGDTLRIAHALLRVMACCQGTPSVVCEGRSKLTCEDVKRVIDMELRNPALSVRWLAQRVGVTPRYLQLLFANEQECVSQYIKRQRLLGCLIDLRDSDFDDRSITDIAFSWGFNSAAHFSSSFKKEFGLNPRAYRASSSGDLDALPACGTDGAMVQAALLLSGDRHRVSGARSYRLPPVRARRGAAATTATSCRRTG